jgi:GMP synthase (glutamine-hydrolysing)
MHENFESPAAIEAWAKIHNHLVSYTHVYANESLPLTSEAFDFLIIMGGPQSPATTLAECPHFNAQKEISLIKNAVHSNKLVFGVCLGAQLIGEALGANFAHSPQKEIGVFPIYLTEAAKEDSIFSQFPHQFMGGHWHNDMPGLTTDAKILAESAGCPRQIVKYSSRVYGFQCHLEFTQKAVADMIKNCSNDFTSAAGLPYVQSPDELVNYDFSKMNQLLFAFLDEFVKVS